MQTSSYDSVLFDLDGTLWDVNATVAKARNNVLKARGIPYREFTAEDVATTVGLPTTEVDRRSFPDFSPERMAEVRPLISAEIQRLIPLEGARLYDGVREGLERLSATHRLFIVSNCGEGYIEAFLNWSALGRLIEDHECFGRTGLSKGSNIRAVVERNGLKRPLYVGDTAGDQKAAIEAGVPYVHVDYGFGDPVQPCLRLARFEDLVTAVLA